MTREDITTYENLIAQIRAVGNSEVTFSDLTSDTYFEANNRAAVFSVHPEPALRRGKNFPSPAA